MMIDALLLAARLLVTDPIAPGEYDLVPVTTSTALPSTSTSSSSSSSSTTTTSSTSSSSASSTSSTTTSTWQGALAFYVSVDGNDATGDGRRSNPFRTANKALAIVKAGDSVLLMDNVDARPHAPVDIVNRTDLTVACEHEGGCSIVVDGREPTVHIKGSTKIAIAGLAVKTADNASQADPKVVAHTIFVEDSARVKIRRNLVWGNNREWNAHPIRLEDTVDFDVVENAVLEHSRHGVSMHGCAGGRVMRNWIDGMGRVQLAKFGSKPPGGDSRESIACYPCTKTIIANNVIEGKEDWGIGLNASGLEEDNLVVGNIVAGTRLGFKAYSRPTGWPVRSIVRDLVLSRIGPSFDVRDQVTIDTTYERVTVFGTAGPGFEVDNPVKSSAQLACTDVSGTPGVTIRDSILGPLTIEPCTGKTRKCAVSNTITGARSIMSGCATSGLGTTLPPELGDSGPGKRLVDLPGPIGADVRCVIGDDGTRTSEDLWGPDGQFRFCPPVRPGWPAGCADYAARRLNQKRDGSGAPLAALRCGA